MQTKRRGRAKAPGLAEGDRRWPHCHWRGEELRELEGRAGEVAGEARARGAPYIGSGRNYTTSAGASGRPVPWRQTNGASAAGRGDHGLGDEGERL